MLSYLPSHEAQHNIIAGKGKPLRWLNELVGHVSTIPLAYPCRVLRATHMEHHKFTNDPAKDCDTDIHTRSTAHFVGKIIWDRQPASDRSSAYGRSLERTGQEHLIIDAVLMQSLYLSILFVMAWTGHALEAFFLWWLPKFLAEFHLNYYLAWKPHQPGVEQGRYRGTHASKSRLGNILSAGIQYHIIHHLYPRIPLSLTPAAYRDFRPILEYCGCDLGGLQN